MFQLLDVLVWFKQYVDRNPTTKNWEVLVSDDQTNENERWIEGEVINHNILKGYAFLSPSNGTDNQFIPPHLITNYGLSNGHKVKGEIEEYTHNRTGELETRVKNIERI